MNAHCVVDGCPDARWARGFCKKHYDRWTRHGDPSVCLKPMVARGQPMAWLMSHAKHSDDACLTWPFARFPDGRAHMKAGKPTRIMCEKAHGPAPSARHEAAHSCGNGHLACVNPRHLRWATARENAADKIAHGTVIRGETHYAARITSQQVIDIRRLFGSMSQREIAERFGVHLSCINKIVNGNTWRHIR